MLTTAVIRELMAAGLQGEALLAALERIEAASVPAKPRSSAAIRQARYRERKASLSQSDTPRTSDGVTRDVTGRNSDVTGDDMVRPPSSPLPSPQTPKPSPLYPPTPLGESAGASNIVRIEEARGKLPKPTAAKRPTRLTEDFELTEKHLAYAAEHGLNEQEARREFLKFQNHFIASGKTKLDWHRTLQNWFLGAVERRYGPRQAASGRNGQPPVTEFRIFERMHAEISARRGADGGDDVDLPF